MMEGMSYDNKASIQEAHWSEQKPMLVKDGSIKWK